MEKFREESQKSLQGIEESLNEKSGISDEDVEKVLKSLKELEMKKTEARLDFVRSLTGTLTTEQQAKLILAPHKMRQEAKRNIKEHKNFRNRRGRGNGWR